MPDYVLSDVVNDNNVRESMLLRLLSLHRGKYLKLFHFLLIFRLLAIITFKSEKGKAKRK